MCVVNKVNAFLGIHSKLNIIMEDLSFLHDIIQFIYCKIVLVYIIIVTINWQIKTNFMQRYWSCQNVKINQLWN